ncbi:MAG: hypothetical protein WC314_15135 [Vulcanimicrobiota bacterium]
MSKLILTVLTLFLFLSGQALAEPAIKSLSLSHHTAQPGQTITGTVCLDTAAPEGGLYVELWCDHEADTPTYVFVPAGALEASFPIAVGPAPVREIKVAALQPTASAIGAIQVSGSPVLSSR